jgi:hypothetical protein
MRAAFYVTRECDDDHNKKYNRKDCFCARGLGYLLAPEYQDGRRRDDSMK